MSEIGMQTWKCYGCGASGEGTGDEHFGGPKETHFSCLSRAGSGAAREVKVARPERKCTCGSEKAGFPTHSTWCDK